MISNAICPGYQSSKKSGKPSRTVLPMLASAVQVRSIPKFFLEEHPVLIILIS
jgi:hypothetical protein